MPAADTALAEQPAVAPPIAALGIEKWPVLGKIARVVHTVTDPTGLAMRSHAAFGDIFTLKIPTFFDLTYVFGDEAFRQVLATHPDLAGMGTVMGNVPGIGFWFPRARPESDHASLQALLLSSRAFMADCVARTRQGAGAAVVERVYDRTVGKWRGTVDLARAVWPAVFEASCRGIVGDPLWDEIGADVLRPLRDLADGIDVVRVTMAVTPLKYFMREYRATKALHKRLTALVDAHRRGPARPFVTAVEALGCDPADVPWLVHYTLWNATVYPGTYSTWALADLLAHPDVADEARAAEPAVRRRLLEHCFHETLRLHPLASIVRHLPSPLEVTAGGRRYRVENGYLGLLPYDANRDPERFPDPERWDPRRYLDGRSKVPMLFGRGAFGCIAQGFSTEVAVKLMEAVITRFDTRLLRPLPPRMCRVHLTYPRAPIEVELRPRA